MKRILIIDDSNTNVVLLEAILINKGYEIEKALNVREAYSMMDKEQPALILLDLLMPQISGYEFLEQIKGDEKTRGVPVIIVSAVANTLNVRKIRDMGVVDYIEKPVNIKELISKVRQALGLVSGPG